LFTRSSDRFHASLIEISRRLDAIEEDYANLKGVTKEIDEIPRGGASHPKTSGHRKEDRCLFNLMRGAASLYHYA